MAGCQQPHCDGIGELAPTPRQLLRPSLPTSPEPLLLSRLNYPKRERERDDGKSNQSFFQRSRPRTLSLSLFRRRRRCHRFEAASHLLSFHSILSAPCCMGVNSKQQRTVSSFYDPGGHRFSAGIRTRAQNILNRSQALYQLSYAAKL